MGLRCEKIETKIEFNFSKNLLIPQSFLIHFIDISPKYSSNQFPVIDQRQRTIISNIGFDQISTVVYYEGIFNLLFIEFNKDYYLSLLQPTQLHIISQYFNENYS